MDGEEGDTASEETAIVSPIKEGTGISFDEKDGKAATIWIDWESDDDPGNPYNFTQRKKWQTAAITCLFTANVAFVGASFASGTATMIRDLNCSRELGVLGLSMFPLGFGISPLVLAPFSE